MLYTIQYVALYIVFSFTAFSCHLQLLIKQRLNNKAGQKNGKRREGKGRAGGDKPTTFLFFLHTINQIIQFCYELYTLFTKVTI